MTEKDLKDLGFLDAEPQGGFLSDVVVPLVSQMATGVAVPKELSRAGYDLFNKKKEQEPETEPYDARSDLASRGLLEPEKNIFKSMEDLGFKEEKPIESPYDLIRNSSDAASAYDNTPAGNILSRINYRPLGINKWSDTEKAVSQTVNSYTGDARPNIESYWSRLEMDELNTGEVRLDAYRDVESAADKYNREQSLKNLAELKARMAAFESERKRVATEKQKMGYLQGDMAALDPSKATDPVKYVSDKIAAKRAEEQNFSETALARNAAAFGEGIISPLITLKELLVDTKDDIARNRNEAAFREEMNASMDAITGQSGLLRQASQASGELIGSTGIAMATAGAGLGMTATEKAAQISNRVLQIMSAKAGLDARQNARLKGFSESGAVALGLAEAVKTYAVEKFAMEGFKRLAALGIPVATAEKKMGDIAAGVSAQLGMGEYAGRSVLSWAGAFLGEGGEEIVDNIGGAMIEAFTGLDPDAMTSENLWPRLRDAFIVGGMVGGFAGGAHTFVDAAFSASKPEFDAVLLATDKMMREKAAARAGQPPQEGRKPDIVEPNATSFGLPEGDKDHDRAWAIAQRMGVSRDLFDKTVGAFLGMGQFASEDIEGNLNTDGWKVVLNTLMDQKRNGVLAKFSPEIMETRDPAIDEMAGYVDLIRKRKEELESEFGKANSDFTRKTAAMEAARAAYEENPSNAFAKKRYQNAVKQHAKARDALGRLTKDDSQQPESAVPSAPDANVIQETVPVAKDRNAAEKVAEMTGEAVDPIIDHTPLPPPGTIDNTASKTVDEAFTKESNEEVDEVDKGFREPPQEDLPPDEPPPTEPPPSELSRRAWAIAQRMGVSRDLFDKTVGAFLGMGQFASEDIEGDLNTDGWEMVLNALMDQKKRSGVLAKFSPEIMETRDPAIDKMAGYGDLIRKRREEFENEFEKANSDFTRKTAEMEAARAVYEENPSNTFAKKRYQDAVKQHAKARDALGRLTQKYGQQQGPSPSSTTSPPSDDAQAPQVPTPPGPPVPTIPGPPPIQRDSSRVEEKYRDRVEKSQTELEEIGQRLGEGSSAYKKKLNSHRNLVSRALPRVERNLAFVDQARLSAISQDDKYASGRLKVDDIGNVIPESLTPAELRRQIDDASLSPENAEATWKILELNAATVGETLEEYVDKRFAGVQKVTFSEAILGGKKQESKGSKLFSNRSPSRKGRVGGDIVQLPDGRAVIKLFEVQNLSTLIHEIAHVFRDNLTVEQLEALAKDVGQDDPFAPRWSKEAEEHFARGFERYLRTGKAPTPEIQPIFAKFKKWLTGIYRIIKGSPIDVDIKPNIKRVFDSLLSQEDFNRLHGIEDTPATTPKIGMKTAKAKSRQLPTKTEGIKEQGEPEGITPLSQDMEDDEVAEVEKKNAKRKRRLVRKVPGVSYPVGQFDKLMMAKQTHEAIQPTVENVAAVSKPVSRQEAADAIIAISTATGADVPFLVGGVTGGKDVMGLYDSNQMIARLREGGDSFVAPHVIGHIINHSYGITKEGDLEAKVGFDAMDDLVTNGIALYGSTQPMNGYADAGFGQYMRALVLNGELTAQEMFPRFHAKYMEMISENSDLIKAIDHARDVTLRWKQQGDIFRFAGQVKPMPTSIDDIKKIKEKYFNRKFANDFMNKVGDHFEEKLPIKRFTDRLKKGGTEITEEDDPYLIAKANRAVAAQSISRFIDNAAINPLGEEVGDSLMTSLNPAFQNPNDARDWQLYMHARRYVALLSDPNGPREAGVHLREAKAIIQEFGNRPGYELAASNWYKWWDNVLDYAGALDPDIKANIASMREDNLKRFGESHGYYIPIVHVDIKAKDSSSISISDVFSVDSPNRVSRKLKGSPKAAKEFLMPAISKAYRLMEMAHARRTHNAVFAALNKAIKDGNLTVGGVIHEIPEGVVKIIAGGEEVRAALKRSFKRMGVGDNVTEVALEEIGDVVEGVGLEVEDLLLDFYRRSGKHIATNMDRIFARQEGDSIKFYGMPKDLYDSLTGFPPEILDLLHNATFKDNPGMAAAAAALNASALLTSVARAGIISFRPGFVFVTSPLREAQSLLFHSKEVNPLNFVEDYIGGLYDSTIYAITFGRIETPFMKIYHNIAVNTASPLGPDSLNTRRITNRVIRKQGPLGKTISALSYIKGVFEGVGAAPRIAEMRRLTREKGWNLGDMTLRQVEQLRLAGKEITADVSAGSPMARAINRHLLFYTIAFSGPRGSVHAAKDHPVQFAVKTALGFGLALWYWLENKDEEFYLERDKALDFSRFVLPIGGQFVQVPINQETAQVINGLISIVDSSYRAAQKGGDTEAFNFWATQMLKQTIPNTPIFMQYIKESNANRVDWNEKNIVPAYLEESGVPESEKYGPYTTEIAKKIGKTLNYSPARLEHTVRTFFGGTGMDIVQIVDSLVEGKDKSFQEPVDIPVFGKLFQRGGALGSYPRELKEFYENRKEVSSVLLIEGGKENETKEHKKLRLAYGDAYREIRVYMWFRNMAKEPEIKEKFLRLAYDKAKEINDIMRTERKFYRGPFTRGARKAEYLQKREERRLKNESKAAVE